MIHPARANVVLTGTLRRAHPTTRSPKTRGAPRVQQPIALIPVVPTLFSCRRRIRTTSFLADSHRLGTRNGVINPRPRASCVYTLHLAPLSLPSLSHLSTTLNGIPYGSTLPIPRSRSTAKSRTSQPAFERVDLGRFRVLDSNATPAPRGYTNLALDGSQPWQRAIVIRPRRRPAAGQP